MLVAFDTIKGTLSPHTCIQLTSLCMFGRSFLLRKSHIWSEFLVNWVIIEVERDAVWNLTFFLLQ
jgi:hypothetical protein